MSPADDQIRDFDDAPLSDIEKALPREQFTAFIEEYLVSAAGYLDRAIACQAAGDLGGVAEEAHKLISVAGSYGLARASRLAREVETACRAPDAARAGELLRELITAARGGWTAMRTRFIDRR